MEFIAGQDLDHVSAACRRGNEPVPLGMSLSVMRDVCQALHYAHTFTDPSGRPSPVIHRDVAQKNIMVTYDGVVKLLDFGIAKARNSLERTRAGMVKGTAGYMSPEQVRGQPLDGRSDVFSAGVVLWELVTGERLFAAETEREEMKMILDAPIRSPRHKVSGVSEELAAVVLRALDRNPGARWQTAKELSRAIEQAGGELLFDVDQRAALMRQLFEQKMLATRALLETVDPRVSGEGGAVPWVDDDEPQEPRQSTQLLEEKPPVAPPPARREVRGKKKAGGEKAPSAGMSEELAAGSRAPATQVSAVAMEDTSESRSLSWVLMGLVVVGIGLGVGYVVLNEKQKQSEKVQPPPEASALLQGNAPPLKTFPEPGQPTDLAPDAGVAESGTAVAGEEPKGEEKGPEEKGGKARVAQGKMTLIINPEAEVMFGKKSLGKTPLFNAPLPVGTHLLRIVGADGKKRMLSVPIKKGETTMLRLGLQDIPTAR